MRRRLRGSGLTSEELERVSKVPVGRTGQLYVKAAMLSSCLSNLSDVGRKLSPPMFE